MRVKKGLRRYRTTAARRRAATMIFAQVGLASLILTFAEAFVSPNAMLVGFWMESLTLYWIVGWLFCPARTSVQTSSVAFASDPTEGEVAPVSGQIRPVKQGVAFCSATE